MSDPTIEPRVTLLESLMGELVAASIRTQQSVEQLSREMCDFKDEMRDFKREMADFKDEMGVFKDEMGVFKDESEKWREKFDENLEAFRKERRDENRKLNKQLGEIANKQGRMAEDLVAPSVGRILREVAGDSCGDNEYEAVRVRTRHRLSGERKEFDAIAVCGDHVLVVETKNSLTPEKVDGFLDVMQDVRNYFPDYTDLKIIGALATLYADPSIVIYASRKGILVLAVGDNLMDIQNEPGFRPIEF